MNQRIAEKTRKDNMKLSEEKRRQDAQIYKIMRAIWNLETEVETMNMQLKLKGSFQSILRVIMVTLPLTVHRN